jgi:SAM-dependent methyltransferase
LSAHLARYAAQDGREHPTAEAGDVEPLPDLPPGGVAAIMGRGGFRARPRLAGRLRAGGYVPLSWHDGPRFSSGDGFTMYARRVIPEPGLEERDRGAPRSPVRVPEVPQGIEQAMTDDLHNLAASERLCDWMFAQYSEHVSGSVAEVGAGIGTFSERILAAGPNRLLLLEPAASCAPLLREKFGGDPRVSVVADELLPEAPSLAAGGFDLIVCQNVLEHIADDGTTVQAMASALAPGGLLALLVPAGPRLFGGLDDLYGHYRRYTRRRLEILYEAAGLEIERLGPFNALGVAGWWVKNRQAGANLDERSLRAYETLVRAWRPIEQALPIPFGLSLIAHGRRPASG